MLQHTSNLPVCVTRVHLVGGGIEGRNLAIRGRNDGTDAHRIPIPTSVTDQFRAGTILSIAKF